MGPLAGLKIIEIVGIGPGPFAGMLLADMGAEVIAVTRPKGVALGDLPKDASFRGKTRHPLDLKSAEGRAALLELAADADALIEGNRPGVMERLGLGPEELAARNKRLVYGRMTGWGQEGPLAQAAGHDLNYAALAGAIHPLGAADAPPTPPLNLVADYGGGAMFLAFGVVCAMLEAQRSGQGQVVDAAMVDGASLMMTMFHSLRASGLWNEARGANFLDGGAHFYGCYRTKDDRFVTLGAIEPQFMMLFIQKAGLDPSWISKHMDQSAWPALKEEMAALFATKTEAEWRELLEGADVCFAPAPPFWEAHLHPHAQARGAFIEHDGMIQPAPAPRFSRTKPEVKGAKPVVAND
ncbi:MAG: CaiB/BaiF CoA-transferase family protein [Pseudomonadota bacterium]